MLGEMFDGQAQAAWAAGADHDPVRAAREKFVGEGVGELLVVDAEVLIVDARFGDAGASAGFESADRFIGVGLGHEAANRAASEPVILKISKTIQIFIRLYFAAGIEI